jgi:dipeptidyl aminopeptidase/acylaminoacyl peptidase
MADDIFVLGKHMRTKLILLLLWILLSQVIILRAQNTLSIDAINWSSTDKYVAITLADRTNSESIIRIYDIETQSLINTFYNTTGFVVSLDWSPDDVRILTNDNSDNSYIRNALTDEILASFGTGTAGLSPYIARSAWNYDGTLIANTYDFGTRFDIRDGLTGESLPDIVSNPSSRPGFIWHDTQSLIAFLNDNQLDILDVISGEIINTFELNSRVAFLDWRDDVLYTIQTPSDSTAITEHHYIFETWDTRTGELLSQFDLGQFGTFGQLELVGDVPQLMVTRNNNTVQIRNSMDGSLEQSQQFERNQRVSFSRNSERYVVATSEGDFEIRNLPLSGESLEVTPSNNIIYFETNRLPSSTLTLSYVDEAPVDYSTDYFGYFYIGASAGVQDNLPYLDVSRDSDWFTYHVENSSGEYDLYEELFRYGSGSILLQSGGWNLYPVFSNALWKEDTEIAFWQSDDNTTFRLSILNPKRELTQSISMPREPYVQAVSWSADASNRLIIFSMRSENEDFDLYQLNLDTEAITPFLEDPANDYSPQWSLSGSELLFVSDRNGIEQIFALNPIDGTVRMIADGQSPQWSPTDNRIAFERDGNIYIINSNGSDEILFVEDAMTPRWLR